MDFPFALPGFLGSHQHESFGLLVGLISIFSIPFLRKGKSPLQYLLICIPYLVVTFKFLISQDLPCSDGWRFHFPAFKYIAEALANGHIFPEWFQSGGGIRIGFSHINLFPYLPHRIVGYLLYSILPVSVVVVYKLQYILGVILMCFGWWLVLNRLTRCRYASYLGTLIIMMAGTGITFHQEQVLATTYLIPWFVLSLLKMREDSSYIFPAVALFGLGLSTHYPQIQLISMGLVVLLMIISYPVLIKKICPKRKWIIALLLFLFLMALSPSYYVFRNIDSLASPSRDTDSFRHQTYEDYLRFNLRQRSSAIPIYYRQFAKPVFQWYLGLDRCSFFVGRIALVLALIWVLTRLHKAIPMVLLLVTFAALTLGVNCKIPIPRYLYAVHFPFIDTFQQWFHFFPMVNFCLSAMAAMGLAGLLRFMRSRSAFFLNILLISVLFFQTADLATYGLRYTSLYLKTHMPKEIYSDFYSRKAEKQILFQYKDRFRLHRFCPRAIPTEPFLTTNIVSVVGDVHKELEKVCEMGFQRSSPIVTNIPRSIMTQALSPSEEISYEIRTSSIHYNEYLLDITASAPSLLVTCLNYDLGPKAYIDGKGTSVYRINSALSGILVEGGDHEIVFRIPGDPYLFTILIQIILYLSLIIFFANKIHKENRHS